MRKWMTRPVDSRFRPWLLVLPVMLMAGAVLHGQLDPGHMSAIRAAKDAGWRELIVSGPFGSDSDASLEERARRSSVVVLSLVRPAIAQTVSSPGLWTWHAFRIEQALSDASKAPTKSSCLGSPDLTTLQAGEVAVLMYGGTSVVDGFKVTFTNGWSFNEIASPRYLAFLAFCAERGAYISDGPSAWLHVDDQGRFIPSGRTSPAVKQVEEMSTVSALSQWLRSLR